MNRKTRWIKRLTVIGSLLFLIMIGFVLPKQKADRQASLEAQNDALTHDLQTVVAYESDYMGDASNLANLFNHLPLQKIGRKYQLDSEALKVTVYYQEIDWSLEEVSLRRNLLYNSVVSMGLIKNLEWVEFEFSGGTYLFSRSDLVEHLDSPLEDLISSSDWKPEFQDKLADTDFVDVFYSQVN